MDFLKVKNGRITTVRGKKVRLRGVALGGWLMMEGYMLGGRNIPEHILKNMIKKQLGEDALREFTWGFRENFITAYDTTRIKKLGANCIRLPFNCRLLEKTPGVFDEAGFKFLEKVIGWFKKKKIYVILDLHAAPGGQNPDWHSDFWPADPEIPRPLLWEDPQMRRRTVALWARIAKRFKDEPAVAGYDILNEPVTTNWSVLNELYLQITAAIRKIDPQHIIFFEGNNYARDFSEFKKPEFENLALSIHFYDPHEFVFNWVNASTYPGRIKDVNWNKRKIKKVLGDYQKLAHQLQMPVYLGEFGVASKCPHCGREYRWVADVLETVTELNWHWTYWTYKSVAGASFPDGIFQFLDYRGLFSAYSLVSGFEKFPRLLRENSQKFFEDLQTENYSQNQKLARIIKRFLKK